MNFILIPALLCYLLAIYTCSSTMLSPAGPNQRRVWLSGCAALLFHGIWIAQHILLRSGQDLSLFNIAVLLSLFVATGVTLGAKRYRLWIILPVVYTCALITLILAALLPHQYILQLVTHPNILIHIGLSLAAFTVVMIAMFFALQLIYLDWVLKRHRPLALTQSLPPLISAENQLIVLIKVATGLLTFSLLTGYLFLDDIFVYGIAHKAILAFLTWCIYATLLWGRYRYGWRGRIVIYLTVAGAIILNLAYFGSRIVGEIIIQG